MTPYNAWVSYHQHLINYPPVPVEVAVTTYEEDRCNPLYINQNTGSCVLKPAYTVQKPYTETVICNDCQGPLLIERWQAKITQVIRTFCACGLKISVRSLIANNYDSTPIAG
ncbi:MAG: hypothetical protein Q8L68_05750 [Methylococcales bacterium]|nr:hypothetical protein [Methylococcales bacterium]